MRDDTKVQFFEFKGGLIQITPAISAPPGTLLAVKNYEPDINGGYRRPPGYERFDGRDRPSDASYQVVACALTSTPAPGTALTIGAATCRFVQAVDGGMVVTAVSGSILGSTSIVATGTIGTTAVSALLTTSLTPDLDALYAVGAADVYRAFIAAVPGSGPVRGVWIYNGTVYAFRNNAGGTAGVMHRSSGSGWTAVTFGEEVAFSNANTSVGDGDTLTQGGVTATIARVVVETGSLASGTNTGRLIITGRSGGNFAAGAATSTGGGSLTISGAQTAITLSPGGNYSFDNYNFFGQQSTLRMYFCNGVDRAMEFDGTTLVPLRTGAVVDTPSVIRGHKAYLFVAQGSSVMFCEPGSPYRWSAVSGAGEVAVGDTVTGLARLPGDALCVSCRNSLHALTGASPTTWSLQVIAPDVGAVRNTLVSMSDTYFLDDRGINNVQQAQEYGNFTTTTLSRNIQPTVDLLRNAAVGAFVIRQRGLYVILDSGGNGVVMGVAGRNITGFTTIQYLFSPSCVCSWEDNNGVERIFAGGSDGFVYELNRGSTFDGAAIDAFATISYNHAGSPRLRKRYRKLAPEMSTVLYSNIQIQPDYSYGDENISSHIAQTITALSAGGSWDNVPWDGFFWDSSLIARPVIPLTGTGVNIALTFFSSTKLDIGHVLQGATIHYSPRRLER